MGQRIAAAVVCGEIDNTVAGRTVGWIWLLGRGDPVELALDGDCWRDLAGARLSFRNPRPQAQPGLALADQQVGLVGDITASRKCRVKPGTVDEFATVHALDEDLPAVWGNSLYLEWFSDSDGRVVIESGDFELKVGERTWEMDGDAEQAQKLANLQAMRDFLQGRIARQRPAGGSRGREVDDEFAWEQRLRESDRLTEAYREVLEKYMGDPDAERKGAFVMGWDGLLEAMAEEVDRDEEFEETWKADDEEGESWKDEDGGCFEPHPFQIEAQELALRAFDLVREHRGLPAAEQLSGTLMQVSGKLAGALGGEFEMEKGYVLAILKRCLGWLNEAIAACSELARGEEDIDHQRALEALRDEVFMLREQLTNFRRDLLGE